MQQKSSKNAGKSRKTRSFKKPQKTRKKPRPRNCNFPRGQGIHTLYIYKQNWTRKCRTIPSTRIRPVLALRPKILRESLQFFLFRHHILTTDLRVPIFQTAVSPQPMSYIQFHPEIAVLFYESRPRPEPPVPVLRLMHDIRAFDTTECRQHNVVLHGADKPQYATALRVEFDCISIVVRMPRCIRDANGSSRKH